MQPSTAMMPYQNSDEDEETARLLGTTILPSTTTTMDDRSSTWTRIAIVAGIMMMLVAGAVLLPDRGRTTAAEGLVVATQGKDPCVPAGGTFSGVSETSSDQQSYAFETCWQFGKHSTYCWTKSYRFIDDGQSNVGFSPCAPKGDAWHAIDADYVNTPGVDPKANPKRCGTPCQGQQHEK